MRTVIGSETLGGLPIDIYRELLGLLEDMVHTGRPININRRFRGVRLLSVDRVLNVHSFTPEFKLEFTVDDMESEYTRDRMEESSRYIPEFMRGSRRSVMINPDHVKVKPTVKLEDHFDKDLFEV